MRCHLDSLGYELKVWIENFACNANRQSVWHYIEIIILNFECAVCVVALATASDCQGCRWMRNTVDRSLCTFTRKIAYLLFLLLLNESSLLLSFLCYYLTCLN